MGKWLVESTVLEKANGLLLVFLRNPVYHGGVAVRDLGPGCGRHRRLQKHENARLLGFPSFCSVWLVIFPGTGWDLLLFASRITISHCWTAHSDPSLIKLLPLVFS